MRRAGFTLIELSLYIALAAVVLLGSSSMLSLVSEARIKDTVISEVEQQSDSALQVITQGLRNATAVNSPTAGASSTSLSINTTVSANNPTVFSLSDGAIMIKEGSSDAVALTNSNVTISSLVFQNLAQTSAKSSVRVSFSASYKSNSTRQVYQYSRNFYGSGSLRQ